MNYTTATHAELAHAGYTVTVLKSAAKKNRKQSWIKPACNNYKSHCVPVTAAVQEGRGVVG